MVVRGGGGEGEVLTGGGGASARFGRRADTAAMAAGGLGVTVVGRVAVGAAGRHCCTPGA